MQQLSKKDQFYLNVGEAMSLNECRCFINMETLEVDIHPAEDYFSFGDMEDTAEEAINNPHQFLLLEHISSRDAFSKKWLEENASDELLQKIALLPTVFNVV